MITAYFVGGPADGQAWQIKNPSWHLRFNTLLESLGYPTDTLVETKHLYERVELLSLELADYAYRYVGGL